MKGISWYETNINILIGMVIYNVPSQQGGWNVYLKIDCLISFLQDSSS